MPKYTVITTKTARKQVKCIKINNYNPNIPPCKQLFNNYLILQVTFNYLEDLLQQIGDSPLDELPLVIRYVP